VFSTAEAALLLQHSYDIESTGLTPGDEILESARVNTVHIAEYLNFSKSNPKTQLKYRDHDVNWYSEWLSPDAGTDFC
jgi:hypothetical protein